MVRLNPRSFRVVETESATDVMRSVEGSDHVGALLREARENAGKTLGEVAQTLRIRKNYLEAIEDGRFSELPGAAYAVGFVRTYAQFLRLDSRSVVERFKQEAAGIETPLQLDFPTPLPEGRFPGGAVVAFCVILAIGVFAGWYWFQSQKAMQVARVPVPPAGLATAPELPADPSDGTASVALPAPAAAGVEIAPDEAASAPTPENPAPAAPADAVPAAAEATLDPAGTTANETAAAEQGVPVAPGEATSPVLAQPPGGEAEPAEEPAPGQAAADPAAAEPRTAAVEEVEDTPAPGKAAPAAEADDSVRISALPAVPGGAPAEGTAASAPDADSAASAGLPAIPALPESTGDDSRVYGVVNHDARIVLRARSSSWVQVRDEAQNVLLTQLLRPGDRYYVPNRSGLTLLTGNAGGLEVSVDGTPVPPLGAEGVVLRNVRLDADALRAGTAVLQ